ncbi:unnamed protein product [Tetraodon nigroviridis]|uniref:Chromosome 7 SCAF14601, whole genome shotgun sequence n=1 Tax=Tetraodon nigroviridis TaxID=99883 RepID=Q4SG19_TETNG|nr:unnamed protein product [Tetraodon nigroviridis]
MVSSHVCRPEGWAKKGDNMPTNKVNQRRVTVTPLEEFLRKPPEGFAVEVLASGYRVHSDPARSLVLIDDLDICGRKVLFHGSLGRRMKLRNLWEYTSARSRLLSKRIYLLVSAHGANTGARGSYVASIDGGDPLIRWQLETGLDWTISSVAGESYRVDVDLTELLQGSEVAAGDPRKGACVWRDACFTLKYYTDALFDFPHWFGFSRRAFKLRTMQARST